MSDALAERDEYPSRERSIPMLVGSHPRGDWRSVVASVESRQLGEGRRAVEPVYFLSLGRDEQGTRVVIATKRAGHELVPLLEPDRVELAHALDRELLGLLSPTPIVNDSYGRPARHRSRLMPDIAPLVLERLARSGRCYLVPHPVPRAVSAEWSSLFAGRKLSRREMAERNFEFEQLLTWPKLSLATGDEPELGIEVREPPVGRGKRPRERAFEVIASLLRGGKPTELASVAYAHRDGWAICGSELLRLNPADAQWLCAITQHGLGSVAEDELPELVERVFGKDGVSALSLPPSYRQAALPPPQPVLALEAPSGRKLIGNVSFDYEGRRLAAGAESPLVLEPGQVLVRHRESEEAALARLERLGFRGDLLGNARTQGVTIDETEFPVAVRTLVEAGWLVEAAGRRYRAPGAFNVEVDSGIDWFEVKGEVRFGTEELPFPRLLAAIKRRASVVQLGDGSWGILPEEWLQRWGSLAQLPAPKGDTLRFSAAQIGLVQALCAALPDEGAAVRGLRELRDRLARFEEIEPAPAPAGFIGSLRPYQERGQGFLLALGELGFGACLADDMGLGKTIQVLSYLASLRCQDVTGPMLVVVPRSLLGNWREEAARFAPTLSVRTHWGAERAREKSELKNVDVVLTTYGTLRTDIELLRGTQWAAVVLDEAQAIKNKHSTTAKCAKLLRAGRRVAMSGTPIENHMGELWSLFEFLNPGLLRELGGVQGALDSPRPSADVLELVRTLVRPFVLRRTKAEVAKDLPERIEQTVLIDLEPNERELYDELFQHYQASVSKRLDRVGAERATPHLLEALLRLRQSACHPGLLDRAARDLPSAKVEHLLERLRALRNEGHRALVFSQFTSLLSIVRERLERENIRFEYLDGKTNDRQACVERFQADPNISAFLISLKAGGVGLNLTGADYVFILDPWWNPAAEAQAIDRAHRIGQKRNVIAYRLLARGTVEERVAALQAQKRALVAGVMGDDAALSTRLTRKDFEALLQLGSEARR